MHSRCTKMKTMTLTLAKGFICEQCVGTIKIQKKKFQIFDQVKLLKSFCLAVAILLLTVFYL